MSLVRGLKPIATSWAVGYSSKDEKHRFYGASVNGNYTRFVGLGFSFMLVIGLSIVLGYVADRIFGTLPLFLLLGMVIGFGVALYYLFVRLKDVGG